MIGYFIVLSSVSLSVRSAPTRDEFKQRLKTHLFRQSYRPSTVHPAANVYE